MDSRYKNALSLAKGGDVDAQYHIGDLYCEGIDLEQSYKKAVSYYERSASRGNALSQNNLAAMYANGTGIKRSLVKAHIWMQLSYNSGNQLAKDGLKYLESEMSEVQIEQAKKQAKNWTPKPPINPLSGME